MQLDGQMHRFFFYRFETYPSSGLRFEPTRTTFRGHSYRHLNRLNRRSDPPFHPRPYSSYRLQLPQTHRMEEKNEI